ncbi:Hypothetical predicted protein [Cloeon dipterum]|uniref:Uncharacterized protein n=1 Tax=Cloeon dipterum TaxID=197152 RepID=A0A8S1CHM0_9INSE|nr:Hypothetical predicted protein [Cloeon dipterum]
MTPIPVTSAMNNTEKLSLLYMFVSWNALCWIGYKFIKSKRPKQENTGKSWAQYIGMNHKTVSIHSFNGLSQSKVEVIKPGELE